MRRIAIMHVIEVKADGCRYRVEVEDKCKSLDNIMTRQQAIARARKMVKADISCLHPYDSEDSYLNPYGYHNCLSYHYDYNYELVEYDEGEFEAIQARADRYKHAAR